MTAAELVNTCDEVELARIFYQYGEERASRRIAKAIVRRRDEKPFECTTDLAQLVESLMPRRGKRTHPATKVFQALRIAVNNELRALEEALADSHTQARQMVTELSHPEYGTIHQIGVAPKFSETPGRVRKLAPQPGEHTEEVLREIGYSAEEIAKLAGRDGLRD